jgi:hypothetical protein
MPNQDNFRSNITTITDPRFLASRIVRFPEEEILLEEVPASFGYDGEDNIEFHFYTIPENDRITSVTAKLSDNIIKSQIVSYNDGTYKSYLQINFTDLFVLNNLVLVPGDYRVVMNFFSDEIGSYDDRRLSITTVGPSRTEIELQFNNEIDAASIAENERLYTEFILPSFNRSDAVGLVQKIFRAAIETNDISEGIAAENIFTNITIPELQLIQDPEDTLDRIERIQQLDNFSTAVDNFLPTLITLIQEEIALNGDDRIQVEELMLVVEQVVRLQISKLQTTIDSRIQIS